MIEFSHLSLLPFAIESFQCELSAWILWLWFFFIFFLVCWRKLIMQAEQWNYELLSGISFWGILIKLLKHFFALFTFFYLLTIYLEDELNNFSVRSVIFNALLTLNKNGSLSLIFIEKSSHWNIMGWEDEGSHWVYWRVSCFCCNL